MKLNSLFIESIRTRSQLFNYQIVRWLRPRKPFWLGVAKSKMFKIPGSKIIETSEEKKINTLLTNHYRTTTKSLINFIKHDNPCLEEMILENVEGYEIKRNATLEKRMEESFKYNESWNQESAMRRDKRSKLNMEKQLEQAIAEVDVHNERRMKEMEIIEEIVRKEKNLSQSYITPENLDEAIEKCLSNVDCFDFAIDLEGNKFHGREPFPSQSVKDMSVEMEAS